MRLALNSLSIFLPVLRGVNVLLIVDYESLNSFMQLNVHDIEPDKLLASY